jgi:hypothetical protein
MKKITTLLIALIFVLGSIGSSYAAKNTAQKQKKDPVVVAIYIHGVQMDNGTIATVRACGKVRPPDGEVFLNLDDRAHIDILALGDRELGVMIAPEIVDMYANKTDTGPIQDEYFYHVQYATAKERIWFRAKGNPKFPNRLEFNVADQVSGTDRDELMRLPVGADSIESDAVFKRFGLR